MTTFAVTRPTLYVVVIRDDNEQVKKALQLLISILLFIWLHRETGLQLARDVGKIVDMMAAIWEVYQLPFKVVLEFATFQLGVG